MMTTLKVVLKDMRDIHPYWRNPRHNDKTIKSLKKSITNYGFNVPLVIDGNGVIITGHARYKALMELGYSQVDCIVADHLTPDKIRAYRLVDNKISELSEWDEELLAEELKMINDLYNMMDLNVDVSGFVDINDIPPENESVTGMLKEIGNGVFVVPGGEDEIQSRSPETERRYQFPVEQPIAGSEFRSTTMPPPGETMQRGETPSPETIRSQFTTYTPQRPDVSGTIPPHPQPGFMTPPPGYELPKPEKRDFDEIDIICPHCGAEYMEKRDIIVAGLKHQ